jgi:phosphoheptose isomerase
MHTYQAFLDGKLVGQRNSDRPYVCAIVLADFDLDAALASIKASSDHVEWYTRYYKGCAAKGDVVASWHMTGDAGNRALSSSRNASPFYKRRTLVTATIKPKKIKAAKTVSNVG